MEKVLIVDGYNMIGAWKELRPLRETNFEEARNRLIALLAEYQAAKGMKVIIVFDAYQVPGKEQSYTYNNLEVIYTKKNETADQRIEKLTNELKKRRTEISVATSDMTQQHVIFGNGALRISARELELDVEKTQTIVTKHVETTNEQKPVSRITLTNEQQKELEKIRRGLK